MRSAGWPRSAASPTCRASFPSTGGTDSSGRGAPPRADLGGRRVEPEPALGNRGEELGEPRGDRDVGQRAHATGRVDPHGHEKPAASIRDLQQRRGHARLVAAVVARRHQALGGVGADDERGAGEEARLLEERRRPRQLDARPPRELREPGAHLARRERRLVDVDHRDLEGDRLLLDVLRHLRQQEMPIVQRIERARQHDRGRRRCGYQLAVGPRRHARDAAGKELIDEIAGLHDRLCVALVGIEQALGRRRGDAARAGEPQHDRARGEILFARAVAPPFRQHDRAVVGAGCGGRRDVEAMLALSRPICDEPRRRAEADQLGAGRHELGRALAGALRHRHRGLDAAGLPGLDAQERGQRPRVVRHQRLEQEPRAAGHAEQLGDRAAAAAGDGEHDLAAGRVHLLDRLPPRRVRPALGFAAVHGGHDGGRDSRWSQRHRAIVRAMRTRLLLAAALAVLPLTATAPAVEPPTFSDDVVRILQARCQTCHRPGEHAPFSLLTYRDAVDKKDDIRDAVKGRVMPPWKPVPGFGDFLESRRLSDAELATLVGWIEAGTPEGDRAKLPPPLVFPEGWKLGPPDHVLEMPEAYTVPARASDVYRCFVIPTKFAEDRWVTKVEYAPGDRKLVHHILAYIDTTTAAENLDRADPGPGYTCFGGPGFIPAGGLSGWAPGIQPRETADGVGMLLPKGANVVIQMHYNNGATVARTDRTRVALHFAKSPIDKRQRGIMVLNRTFTIPSGERRYEVRGSWTNPFNRDLHASTITPHMHLLGRDMKVTATYPDGTVRPLIHIDDWDFNWQTTYTFARPIPLPAGTRLDMLAVFDNSADNLRQPSHPPRPVSWGEGTTDEMAIVFLGVTVDAEHIGWRPR